MERFKQTHKYKLIYVMSIPYETHKGLLKVGDATITTNITPDNLVPNCLELNQAAKQRIDRYTKTAGIEYKLEYTELAIRQDSGFVFPFRDKDVHEVLMNSGIHKVKPNGNTGIEWFETNLETVKAAINCFKNGKESIPSNYILDETQQKPVDFREEQLQAVNDTLSVFEKDNEMLWYAKMRFGKTLTALEVIRRCQFRRVIIITHRPVVDDGWSDDFKKIFFTGNSENEYHYERKSIDSYDSFDKKIDLDNDTKICSLDKNNCYFVYFASIQDLRGSQKVGGKYNKNNAVFDLDWDLIIIDEAHEGTQTELGDNVIKTLRKNHTKILALSGTPFNLLSQYSNENTFTWDYVMEQKKKAEWDKEHYGDHNPYADLPKMHIYTYDLGEKLKRYALDEYDTKAFNFREFFRVWYKGPNGKRELPKYAVEGKFVHEQDIVNFLNLLSKKDTESGYPFSNSEYRDMFRHTLWIVPGVKEAKALSELLRNHPVFKNFGIANVAGEGDKFEEDHFNDALELVRNTIKNNSCSITLSCGKLTTGVTVKEWTAVLMLSGSYSTATAQYMQTIFRVQSAGSIDGKQKTDCYVFDFAPDRTLKVLTETVNLSSKPGKNQKKQREAMTEFLNYCPVIAISGSKTKAYSVESMMEQIKYIYAERAVNSGFEDESLYNEELLKIDEIDASKFNELKKIVGSSKGSRGLKEVVVNEQGLTDEQIEHIDDPEPSEPATPLTPEEIEDRNQKKRAKEARKRAISILRGVSIRMPLLIYGADVPIEEDIDIDRFIDIVDDESWNEFMPNGVTKTLFMDFTKYYDRDIFISAGKRIRKLAAAADRETPTRRVAQIAEIFRHFKNPDKETILTPWRVVNLHMSETIGGWCFFDEEFQDDTPEKKHRLSEPRFVDRGEVTQTVFGEKSRILEINSKSGLYPLYVAYSSYKQRMEGMSDDDWSPDDCQYFWNETIENNIFVICKTPMAKSITRRTLCGYSNIDANAEYYENLVDTLKNNLNKVSEDILSSSYWNKDGGKMFFDAVVGNPPYQVAGGSGGNNDAPLYQEFVYLSKSIDANYSSLIIPSRWFSAGRENLLGTFRKYMLKNKHLKMLKAFTDSTELFQTVEIKGGICYYLIDKKYEGNCEYTLRKPNSSITIIRDMDELDVLIREPLYAKIVLKVKNVQGEDSLSVDSMISNDTPFGIPSNPRTSKKTPFRIFKKSTPEHDVQVYHIEKLERKIEYVCIDDIKKNNADIDKYKVLIPGAGGSGIDAMVIGKPEYAPLHSVCSQSYLYAAFNTEQSAKSFLKYIKTRFVRSLIASIKISQSAPNRVYRFVPIQDFTENSDIDWSKSIHEIDLQLYEKYGLSEDEIDFIEENVKPMDD